MICSSWRAAFPQRRLFPNFSFIDAPYNLQYYKPGNPDTEIAYMGCRTRVIGNAYDPTREIVTGRGNLSFTSINLPRLAIESKGDIDLFYEKLDAMMDLVVDQLLSRFKIQVSEESARTSRSLWVRAYGWIRTSLVTTTR